MTNKIKKSLPAGRQGFTLIETLAAVLLLSIALVGPMVIAQKGLSTALISKDQNSAFNLAQDAVEYVRFARDTNCLVASKVPLTPCPGANWLTGGGLANTVNLTPCVSTNTLSASTACYVDSQQTTLGTVTACASGLCPPINYDSTNNYFSYTSGVPTIFKRTVQILTFNGSCTGVCNQNEADIIVTVSWNDPIAHSIQVNESLYDWQ